MVDSSSSQQGRQRMEGTPLKDTAAILLDESRRQITRQEADLDTLRNRAVGLLSVGALVAGLFGGRVVGTGHHPHYVAGAIIGALALFGLSALAIVFVLFPRRKGWEFAQNLGTFFDGVRDGTLNPIDVSYNLAEWVEESRKKNQELLEEMYAWFAIAMILMALEVIAWGIAAL